MSASIMDIAMGQFRVERNQYGNMWILELVRTVHGHVWREVCLRQLNQKTGEYE